MARPRAPSARASACGHAVIGEGDEIGLGFKSPLMPQTSGALRWQPGPRAAR